MCQEVKKEFDCKTEEFNNAHTFSDNMAFIKKETDRIIKSQIYLEEYEKFLTRIGNVLDKL